MESNYWGGEVCLKFEIVLVLAKSNTISGTLGLVILVLVRFLSKTAVFRDGCIVAWREVHKVNNLEALSSNLGSAPVLSCQSPSQPFPL